MSSQDNTPTIGERPSPPGTPDAPPPDDEPDGPPLTLAVEAEADDPPDAPPLRGELPGMRRMLLRVCEMLGVRLAELSVVIIDDARMAQMHQQYRGEEDTTDVLSFDLSNEWHGQAMRATDKRSPRSLSAANDSVAPPEPQETWIEGEIYICLDEARRRADELGHPVRSELMLYAVHGLLHLVGYDDHDPDSRRIMHRKEDELLSALGLGPVYHCGGSRP